MRGRPPYPGAVPPLPSRSAPAPVRLAYAVAASVLAGLLMAGAAFPIVGGLGLTAKAGADEFLVLPAEFDQVPLAQRSRILASDGSLLAILYRENRVFAPLKFIPEQTQKAFIAVEDARFYAHDGIDYKGTLRAAVQNSQAGSVTQGGSTLTQQYVKNALLQAASTQAGQDAAREVSLERKLKEARYALAIERKLTKDEILERYLNIAYFGNGVYGVGTASTFYFGKPARDLTLGESALLAGIVQSPGRFDPVKATEDVEQMERLVARRNLVLGRMKAENFIDEAERAAAAAAPPAFRFRPVLSGCENPAVKAPYFCDYVRRYLEEDTEVGAELGRTREERQDRLLAGGLTIKTTLDPVVQEAAQRAAEEAIPPADTFRGEDFGAATAVNVVQPGTGDVRAMAVNRRYTEQKKPGHTKVNLAIGGSSGFQGGSTFKAFVLADALRQGIPLSFTAYAPQKYTSAVFLNYTPDGVEPYTMQNAGDSESGTFDVRTATHDSVNTFFIQLEERTGVEGPASLAEAMGLKQFKDGSPSADLLRGGSFVLGSNEVSPLSLAAAYATFAARGQYCPPRPVTEILDSRNQPIELRTESCRQVLEPEVADTVTDVLTGVIDGDTRGRTGRAASIGRPAAGKTGTTNGSKAAWFVGYTPQLATSVWVGDPGAPGRAVKEMRRVTINGRYYNQVYGGTLPARIWRATMSRALREVPVERFAAPDRDVVRGQEAEVPDVRGMSYDEARQVLTDAGFGIRDGGRVSAAPIRRGDVAYTSPRAGRTVRVGATVTIFVSNGRERVAPPPSPAEEPAPPPAEPTQESTAAGKGRGNGNGRGNG